VAATSYLAMVETYAGEVVLTGQAPLSAFLAVALRGRAGGTSRSTSIYIGFILADISPDPFLAGVGIFLIALAAMEQRLCRRMDTIEATVNDVHRDVVQASVRFV
jgi:hypothetical protein